MKGNEKLVEKLNLLLADELTAISQYMVHAEICENWGYVKLHDSIRKRSIDEMKHAEILIGRILFLEGKPIVSKLNDIKIGQEIPLQLKNDRSAEEGAIKAYNEAIKLAVEVNDSATKNILESILNDEDKHIDKIEELQDQVEQLTLPIFLSMQTG